MITGPNCSRFPSQALPVSPGQGRRSCARSCTERSESERQLSSALPTDDVSKDIPKTCHPLSKKPVTRHLYTFKCLNFEAIQLSLEVLRKKQYACKYCNAKADALALKNEDEQTWNKYYNSSITSVTRVGALLHSFEVWVSGLEEEWPHLTPAVELICVYSCL